MPRSKKIAAVVSLFDLCSCLNYLSHLALLAKDFMKG